MKKEDVVELIDSFLNENGLWPEFENFSIRKRIHTRRIRI